MRSFNLINGNIITLNPKLNHAHSLSIDNGKIKYINKTIPTLKTYDLKGATVIPGFIDAHFHLKNYGKRLEQIDLKNIKSIKEIKSIIKNKLKKIKKGDWVLGFGWDQNLWEGKRFPSADILDNHLKETVSQIQKRGFINLLAIGIGHDVSKYYNNAFVIDDINSLGDVIIENLSSMLLAK